MTEATAGPLERGAGSQRDVPIFDPVVRSSRGSIFLARLASCSLAAALAASLAPAAAQTDDPSFALAERSAIVVEGKVVQAGASAEPLLAASESTAIIEVQRMYAGSEIAGDKTGQAATVILTRPGRFAAGASALFFGNPRFIGKTITIADEGELPLSSTGALPPGLAAGLTSRRDLPVRGRLAIAALVFSGTVESVRQLEGAETRGETPRDEHDPDWQVAMMRVESSLRGTQPGVAVPVVFPASRDIFWFNTPKLAAGQEVLILGHRPQPEEMPLLRGTGILPFVDEQQAVLATHPFDILPLPEAARVSGLLKAQEVR